MLPYLIENDHCSHDMNLQQLMPHNIHGSFFSQVIKKALDMTLDKKMIKYSLYVLFSMGQYQELSSTYKEHIEQIYEDMGAA